MISRIIKVSARGRNDCVPNEPQRSKVQFVLQNCEKLHSVLYDKKTASQSAVYLPNVIYKKYKRLVYTPPDLLARFCKVNLSNTKRAIFFLFYFFNFGLPFRQRNTSYKLQRVTDWLPPRTIVSYNRPLKHKIKFLCCPINLI